MKAKLFVGLLLFILVLIPFTASNSPRQQGRMIFCEHYNPNSGAVGIGTMFSRGNISVIVELSSQIYYNKIFLQLDLYNPRSGQYEYYYSYEFNVDPSYTYIYFNNIYFGLGGHYRVFLLDPNRNVITNGLVEIL